jgi:hypothetical protein
LAAAEAFSTKDPIEGLRVLDRKARVDDPDKSEGSSFGRGGGARLVKGAAKESIADSDESVRERDPMLIFRSVFWPDSLRARTPGMAGGSLVGIGGRVIETRCDGKLGKSDEAGTAGKIEVGGE